MMLCLGEACWNTCTSYHVYSDACRRTDVIISLSFFILLGLGLWWMSNDFSMKWLRHKKKDGGA